MHRQWVAGALGNPTTAITLEPAGPEGTSSGGQRAAHVSEVEQLEIHLPRTNRSERAVEDDRVQQACRHSIAQLKSVCARIRRLPESIAVSMFTGGSDGGAGQNASQGAIRQQPWTNDG